MKALTLIAITALTFSAQAKTFTVKSDEAVRLVEGIAGAAGWVAVDATTMRKTLLGPLQCRYSTNAADGVMEDVHCYSGLSTGGGGPLGLETANGLPLLQSIRPYAKKGIIIGFPGMQVDGLSCVMKTSASIDNQLVRNFTCKLTVN